jgi:hypothetical protein
MLAVLAIERFKGSVLHPHHWHLAGIDGHHRLFPGLIWWQRIPVIARRRLAATVGSHPVISTVIRYSTPS